jgi:hypothetical protein
MLLGEFLLLMEVRKRYNEMQNATQIVGKTMTKLLMRKMESLK